MLSHLSASLSHSSPSLSSTALRFRPLFPKSPPSLLPLLSKSLANFHFHPSNIHTSRPRPSPFCGVLSGSSMESPSVESISDELKKQSLGPDEVRLNLEDLRWDNSFVRELPGDPKTLNIPRQVDFVSLIGMYAYIL